MRKLILKIEDLHYSYGNGKSALNGVNVDIYEGEKIAVIGSNGSGKSTFFLNLDGVLTPEQGKIIYRDTVINKKNLKELRKNIGIVFQDADNQIIASTVRAEVGFGPMNLKLPKEEVLKRVDEALEYMNISHLKDRPPHYLSGGEKKRVSIADIIAMKSEIIIFDEPTAALDPLNAMMLEEVLLKLGAEGKTMLISTHDVDFTYRWAERVLVFNEGKIIADGLPIEIFQNKEILKQANLKQPTLLEVYESLIEKNILKDIKSYPKSVKEFKEMLQK
ncbi:energy-coupling factor ABC transporter ATP-binding protein [Clostridium beijerinckii]|uniref:energy-coupling factor ABC transporter ATP-binding protein n=1 Tax=Clostridium beijerinckii TaxID=1520 RepID=UPI00098CC12F|nr:ABC transporter ATP-binding protein [Clostridium beijerinckii]MBA8933687.1 cobalt/nickel transport system ATP-binding protein [Clostridium beijerinckii]NRU37885.1 cobalt/nickel transport system ATP-binding protein [Clostridium beijerinckii]NSA98836.1 cobalt/nickel transport system ATP-binding protein [Clostridium beijerinckii]OOM66900.1 energy-coupling factor transporter ATP-binding protein EcfA3 [Clostridium beijerinckii]OOM70693.1 energy-coupling factor transporter ATP-binding protein Ecf